MYQQNIRSITNSQAEWTKFGKQMSTDRRVVSPSDDPIAALQAVILSQTQMQNSQYTLARSFAMQEVSLEENVLGQVMTVIQAAQEKIVYTESETLSDDDRVSLAIDLQGIRDQLMNLANSIDGNGRYVSGECKTGSVPFVRAGGAYSGGTTNVTQQVDVSRTIVINHTGDKVFTNLTSNAVPEPGGGTQEKNPFKMLDTTIDALKTPAAGDDVIKTTAAATIGKANRSLENSFNNVLSTHAELGTQLNEPSSLDSLGAGRASSQTQQMSSLVDVDWSAAISSYVMQRAALQTSYKAFTDIQGMSLLQLNC